MGQVVLSKRSDGNVNLFMIRKLHYESKILLHFGCPSEKKGGIWQLNSWEWTYPHQKVWDISIYKCKKWYRIYKYVYKWYISGIYCQLGEKNIFITYKEIRGTPEKTILIFSGETLHFCLCFSSWTDRRFTAGFRCAWYAGATPRWLYLCSGDQDSKGIFLRGKKDGLPDMVRRPFKRPYLLVKIYINEWLYKKGASFSTAFLFNTAFPWELWYSILVEFDIIWCKAKGKKRKFRWNFPSFKPWFFSWIRRDFCGKNQELPTATRATLSSLSLVG